LDRWSQHAAVGPCDFAEINVVATAFYTVANQGDLVPNLHGIFVPTLP
jgi:hypothetical protein